MGYLSSQIVELHTFSLPHLQSAFSLHQDIEPSSHYKVNSCGYYTTPPQTTIQNELSISKHKPASPLRARSPPDLRTSCKSECSTSTLLPAQLSAIPAAFNARVANLDSSSKLPIDSRQLAKRDFGIIQGLIATPIVVGTICFMVWWKCCRNKPRKEVRDEDSNGQPGPGWSGN